MASPHSLHHGLYLASAELRAFADLIRKGTVVPVRIAGNDASVNRCLNDSDLEEIGLLQEIFGSFHTERRETVYAQQAGTGSADAEPAP